MKARTNIILLVVLLALCGGYWLMIKGQMRQKEQIAEAKRLFDYAPTDIERITIQREGEKATAGARGPNGAWTIDQPSVIDANPQVWERVAKNLAELANQRVIDENPQDLGIYGLSEPRLSVIAKTKNGDDIKLKFGEMEPTQKFRYGQQDGGPVFLVSPDQFFELDRDLLWLRDRDLFKEGEEGITHIEFTPIRTAKGVTPEEGQPAPVERGVSVIAEKNAQGDWQVLAPNPGTADQEMLKNLATELEFAMGRDYIDEPESLKDYNLDPPKAQLIVKSGAAEPQTIFIGGYEPAGKEGRGLYVMQDTHPSVFVTEAQLVPLLPFAGPDAWREKSILTRKGSEITSIKYQAGPQSFLLVNEANGWRLKEPIDQDTDQGAVSMFIGKLLEMKGSESYVQRLPEFGLDVPSIRITVTYKDSETPAELLVGSGTSDGTRFYMTQDSGVVVTVAREDVEALAVTPKNFMNRGLIAYDKNQVTEVKLEIDGVPHVFAKGETAWKIQEPAGKVWESQDDMQAILDAFKNFKAESVEMDAAPADLAIFGLDKPAIVAQFTLQQPDNAAPTVLGPIRIGGLCPDDDHLRFAMIEGRPHIYRVKQAVVGAVRTALRGVVAE